ncbi:MAG: hypothetical protein E7504_04240 [Ruminococcus sp.]|nr:hypothetical protein [Ruminococcus sp.]
MSCKKFFEEFLDKDESKCEEIAKQYPINIPVSVVADLLGCSKDFVRNTLAMDPVFGLCERREGKQNRGFLIPTATFFRWYLKR